MKTKISKKILALGAGALVLAGAIGAGISYTAFPQEVEVQVIKEVQVNNTVEVPVEVIKEVTISKEVLVDNGKLDAVLQEVYDSDGNLSISSQSRYRIGRLESCAGELAPVRWTLHPLIRYWSACQ
jgi:hypothetical protein